MFKEEKRLKQSARNANAAYMYTFLFFLCGFKRAPLSSFSLTARAAVAAHQVAKGPALLALGVPVVRLIGRNPRARFLIRRVGGRAPTAALRPSRKQAEASGAAAAASSAASAAAAASGGPSALAGCRRRHRDDPLLPPTLGRPGRRLLCGAVNIFAIRVCRRNVIIRAVAFLAAPGVCGVGTRWSSAESQARRVKHVSAPAGRRVATRRKRLHAAATRSAKTDACGRSFAVLSAQASTVDLRLRLVVFQSVEVCRDAATAGEEQLVRCAAEQSKNCSSCTVTLDPCGDLPIMSWGR